jgi:hypothetical protein
VALLLRDREAPSEAAAPPPDGDVHIAVAELACEACGAQMQRGQDWCLECGTAAPGRLGARPGWRAAFTVVGLTLLLVCGAVIASYAALTSDAQRTAAAPSTGSASPIVAETPPAVAPPVGPGVIAPPGATGPGTTVAPLVPGAAPQPIIPATKPPLPATNTPVAPAPSPAKPGAGPTGPTGPAPATSKTPSKGARGPQATAKRAAPQVIKLKPDAARTYNPAKRAGAEFGPAAQAIDAKPDTVWDVVVPADGQPLGVGLLVDLGAPYALSSLKITTPTPGFRVELYGAVDGKELPEDIFDKRWIHLTDRKAVADGRTISLKGKGDGAKVRVFLLHLTMPAERSDPRVAIGDLEFRGAP